MRGVWLILSIFCLLSTVAFSQGQNSHESAPKNRTEATTQKSPATESKLRRTSKPGEKATSKNRSDAGEKTRSAQSESSTKRTPAKLANVGPEREAAAVKFAELHHPELMNLLRPLKEQSPREYQRAIRELFRTSERLNQIREHSLARYELELEEWKLGSRIRLRAVRFAMSSDPEREQELRELIAQHLDIRVQLLELQRTQLQEKLDRLDSLIEETKDSRERQAEIRLKRLLKSIPEARTGAKTE